MKTAKYIIKADIGTKSIYYNLTNGTMIEVDGSEKNEMEKCLKNPNDKENQLWKNLSESSFILDNYYDEIKAIKLRHWKKSFDSDSFEVTIIPTLRCNEKCSYCYQAGTPYDVLDMDDKDFDDIYRYLTSVPNKNILVNWYGGEPLLCKDKIIAFCKRLNNDSRHIYTHSISTNATIFDYDFYKSMVDCGLTVVDTTIVGKEKDFTKLNRSNGGGYKKVKDNIARIAEIVPVVVSINLCRTNIDGIEEVFNDFTEYSNLSINFSFTRIVSYDNNPCSEIELDIDTYIRKVIFLSNYAIDKGLHICDMSCFESDGIYCGAYSNNNITIAPEKYVFKCENSFLSHNAIGRIENGNLVCNHNTHCHLCVDPYDVSKCRDCTILPYCNGGCIHMRNLGKNYCPAEKDYLVDFLKLYYRKNYEENV